MLGRGISTGLKKDFYTMIGKNFLIKNHFHMEVKLTLIQLEKVR